MGYSNQIWIRYVYVLGAFSWIFFSFVCLSKKQWRAKGLFDVRPYGSLGASSWIFFSFVVYFEEVVACKKVYLTFGSTGSNKSRSFNFFQPAIWSEYSQTTSSEAYRNWFLAWKLKTQWFCKCKKNQKSPCTTVSFNFFYK